MLFGVNVCFLAVCKVEARYLAKGLTTYVTKHVKMQTENPDCAQKQPRDDAIQNSQTSSARKHQKFSITQILKLSISKIKILSALIVHYITCVLFCSWERTKVTLGLDLERHQHTKICQIKHAGE